MIRFSWAILGMLFVAPLLLRAAPANGQDKPGDTDLQAPLGLPDLPDHDRGETPAPGQSPDMADDEEDAGAESGPATAESPPADDRRGDDADAEPQRRPREMPRPRPARPVPPRREAPRPTAPFRPAAFQPQTAQRRLPSVPDMFGDTYFGSPSLGVRTAGGALPGVTESWNDLPLAAGSNRVKIGENNQAVPTSRVYYMFQHFRSPFHAQVRGRTAGDEEVFECTNDFLSRYTIGWEQALFCRQFSIEVRMPFAGMYNFDFATPPTEPAGTDLVRGGEVGNLTAILKHLVYSNPCTAVSWGVGIQAPTGSDVWAVVDTNLYTIENNAVHISPFLAYLQNFNSCWFVTSFAQLDLPTNGNTVRFENLSSAERDVLGQLTEQTLLHVDLSVGRWLYRNPCCSSFRGLAALAEFHMTTTLQDSDEVRGFVPAVDPDEFLLKYRQGRWTMLNASAGLHAEVGCGTEIRLGGIFPLSNEENRLFDAEIGLQINKNF